MSIETCRSSGLKSADAVISARPCKIHSVTLLQASAACTILIYDNKTTNTGTVVAQLNNTVDTTTVNQVFNIPVECLNGAYADVTGSGANYIVHYSYL